MDEARTKWARCNEERRAAQDTLARNLRRPSTPCPGGGVRAVDGHGKVGRSFVLHRRAHDLEQ